MADSESIKSSNRPGQLASWGGCAMAGWTLIGWTLIGWTLIGWRWVSNAGAWRKSPFKTSVHDLKH
jgi:hypothetical protein